MRFRYTITGTYEVSDEEFRETGLDSWDELPSHDKETYGVTDLVEFGSTRPEVSIRRLDDDD